MLTPYLPYPLISGGQIRSFNLLKNLAKKHEISLVSLIKHDDEKQYISSIAPFCHKVIVSKRPEKPWTIPNIWKTIFGKYPFLVVRNFSAEAKQAVIDELANDSFDLIHAETFYVMPHIPPTKVPILLVEQTIEYQVYQHFVETIGNKLMRNLFSLDVGKIRYWEEYYWRRASRVVAMSEPDKAVMQSRVNNLEVSIVPNGVDSSYFRFQEKTINKTPKILFVGNFKWLQNREAVTNLVEHIWPIIERELPNSRLWIVGKFPTAQILKYQSPKIIITDTIEDIRQAYQKSDLLLAPIYGPGGTRYKILEAMAMGVPVVTTPLGISGLGASDNKELLLREDPSLLAEAAIKILTNQKLYKQLAYEAHKLVTKAYNWVAIADNLDRIYESVAHEKIN